MFSKPNRIVKKVFIHCSDSDIDSHDNIDTIRSWHIERGFRDIGYHYFINKYGKIFIGRDIERIPAAQKGFNDESIAICLSGRVEFTKKQIQSLKDFCSEILLKIPNITFHGHKEVCDLKSCPNFNYKSILNLDKYGKIIESNKNINLIYKNMNWKEIISKVAPSLGSAITNPLGFITDQGLKIISKALTGKSNAKEDDIAKEVSRLSTSELSEKLLNHEVEMRKVINDTKKIELEKLKEHMKSVQSARDEVNFLNKSNPMLSKGVYYLAFFVVISAIMFFISASILSVFFNDDRLHLIREIILIMEGMAISVMSFFFGSSYSRKKD